MSDSLRRMRRDLTEAVAEPVWPPGHGLRTFTPKDAPAVHRLLEAGYAQGGGEVAAFGIWWPGLRDDAQFAADLCFLALDENQAIVGVAQCWTSGFVKDLVVCPGARRRGLAQALLTTAFREFRRRGLASVDLKVRVDNPSGAICLYQRLGMRAVPLDGAAASSSAVS